MGAAPKRKNKDSFPGFLRNVVSCHRSTIWDRRVYYRLTDSHQQRHWRRASEWKWECGRRGSEQKIEVGREKSEVGKFMVIWALNWPVVSVRLESGILL